MQLTQWLLLVVLSVLWGGSFLFVGIAVQELPPLTLVLLRVSIAAAILLPMARLLGFRFATTLAGWVPFAVMGVLNNIIPFTLIFSGQREIASGLASVINATTPVFTLLIARGFGADPKLAPNKLAGTLIGIAGVAILVGQEALLGQPSSVLGMLLGLGGALSYGFSGLWGRRFKESPPLVTAASQLTCSTLLLAPIALLIDQPWQLAQPSPATVLSVLALAVLSTALAYVIFFRIMAVSGPNNVMLVTLLIPVSAIWLGATVLNEVLAPRHFAGALVIGLSLIVIDGRAIGWFSRQGK